MKIKDFKTEDGNTVRISLKDGIFSATIHNDIIQTESQVELERIIKEKSEFKFDWKPAICITLETRSWGKSIFKMEYEKVWISEYLAEFKISEWENYHIDDKGISDMRGCSSRKIHYEGFTGIPYHNAEKMLHIVPYNEVLWENLKRVEEMIMEIARKLNEGFSDVDFLRLPGSSLIALMEGEKEEQ